MVTKSSRQVYFGLSTDTKPASSKINNGDVFIEMDTSKIYFFSAEEVEWHEWGNNNG